MKNEVALIKTVDKGSIAEEAGIETGDIVMSVNGKKIEDIFDYRFLTSNEHLNVQIEKKNGEVWDIEIDKDEYEDLGIEFENPLINEEKSCNNKCVFCFIDQLPVGMRETLYFKDDDTRLSFLTGNYVTLTNIKDSDLDKIIKYKLTPVNISVHTTNADLRKKMMNNRFAGDIAQKMAKLAKGGIRMNCQIVACPGINDGNELKRTLDDLSDFYPSVQSISVVPVGLTKYREGLAELVPFDKKRASAILRIIEDFQKIMLNEHGTRLVYAADEFYQLSGRKIPEYDEYEDFPQIENGVGLLSLLKHEFYENLSEIGQELAESDLTALRAQKRQVAIATGKAGAPLINELASVIEERFGVIAHVYPVDNKFFGENVTVTGLLTGKDIIRQLKGKKLGSALLISKSAFKADEEIMLDDITVEDIEKELKVNVKIVQNSGKDFIEKVLGIDI